MKLKNMNRFVSLLICFSILAGTLTIVSAAETTKTKTENIIITVQDNGYKEEGDWKDSDVLGYNKIPSRLGLAQSTATWTPNIKEAGYYKVYFYKVVNQSESDERGRVDVFHSEGSDSKFFDFTSGSSDWMDMGIYYFEEGSKGCVKVAATEYARASAVRFERIAEVDEEDFPPMFTDIKENPNEQAITVMGGLGIFNGNSDGTFSPDDNITRGEFSAIVVRLLGMTDVASSYTGENAFSDVGGSYFGLNEINLAASLKIINGYEEGTFGPDDYLTYEQAVKIMVTLLGYKVQAELKGGYPDGYLMLGADLKVTSGVAGTMGQPISRASVAKMAYNSLQVPIMEQTGTMGQEGKFTTSDDVTLLSKYLHLTKVQGVVSSNENTTLLGANHNAKGEVVINSQTYRVGETHAEDYLGYYVTAYAKEEANSSGSYLVFVCPKAGENEKLVLKADEISSTTTKRQLDYMSGDSRFSVKISPIARMIYNGVALPSFKDANLKPPAGKVELIDSTGSGEYDVIIVTSYINYVVSSVSNESKKIYGKNNATLNLDKSGIKYIITKDNAEITLDALKEWDVLSVAADKEIINADGSRRPDYDNAVLYNIKVSSEKIEGKVTETNYDTDENGVYGTDSKLTILGKEYMLAQNIRSDFVSGVEIAPTVGDTGTFYLDFEGKIAAVDIGMTGAYTYGYVIDAAVSGKMDAGAQLKILTQKDEKVVVLNTKQTVELIDPNPVESYLVDKGYEGDIRAEDLTKRFKNAGEFVPCLIAYKKDSNGRIKTIYKAVIRGTDVPDNYPLVLGQEMTNAGINSLKFDQQLYITPDTLLFKIPNPKRVSAGFALDSEYEVVPSSWFPGGEEYNILAYNMTDTNLARIIVFSGKDGVSVPPKSTCIMVDKVGDAVNKKGETTKIIYGYQDGVKISATFSDSTLEYIPDNPGIKYDIRRGDAVKLAINSDNEITAIEIVQTVSQLRTCITDPNYLDLYISNDRVGNDDFGNDKRYVTGTPMAKDGDVIRLEVVGFNRDEIAVGLANMKVMIYDELEDEVYVGRIGDIIDEKTRLSMGENNFVSKCLLQTVWANPVSLFYYKLKSE